MISVRITSNKADVVGFLAKGYGLKAFDVFMYISGTVVTYRNKVMKFDVNSDLGSVTYSFTKKTFLGTYKLYIVFYIVGSLESPRVSVEVKGKNKFGYPKVEDVARSFNLAKFTYALELYEKLYGSKAQKTELLNKEKVTNVIKSLSSKKGTFKLAVSNHKKTVNVLINDGAVKEVGGSLEDLEGDILLVRMGETTKELAV